MRRRTSIAATLLLLVVAVSCSGDPDEDRVVGSAPQSTEDVPGDVATTETPRRPARHSRTQHRRDRRVRHASGAVLGAIPRAPRRSRRARAEALVVLGSGDRTPFRERARTDDDGVDPDPASIEALRTLSNSTDVTERLLAAGTLAALGEKNGVDVLIDAMVSDELLRNVDPPFAAWRYSRANLLLFIDQDLGLADARDAAATAAAQPAWMDWWAAHAAELTWNAELGRYEAPA